MENKVIQKAGENSQQIQAQTVIFNQGIEEIRARQIFMEMFEVTRKELSREATEEAKKRVLAFEDKLIKKFQKIDGALEQFADPAFQMILTSAHKTAVSTENDDDYLILSELLAHRVKKGNDRKSSAGVRKAIEIVNDVTEEALLGLTVIYAWEKIVPESGVIEHGLNILDNLFSKLIYDELPVGKEWIENLAILNAIRITDFKSFLKVEDSYSQRLEGYSCVGIKKETETHVKALQMLKDKNMDCVLIDHELNDGYVRLALVEKDRIELLKRTTIDMTTGESKTKELLKDEKEVLYQIYDMYEKNDKIHNDVKNNLKMEIRKRVNLLKLIEWVQNIKQSFDITPVGSVLAHANAQKIEEEFPALD